MSEEQFENIRQLFADLARELKPALDATGADWRVEPAAKSFRVYLAHWFDGQVHFESWVTNADIERQSLPVAFHFEAPKEKTGIKRTAFSERLLETAAPMMDGWEGYRLSPKSDQPFIRKVAFSDHLLADMKAEYCRLAKLAPLIDQAMMEAKTK
ncbi:MAG TPA: hypothetical protein VE986_10370 [Hyphomicrobiales bacterium]|nr:hypothetical protein [Hyphomicrobiales bacterium]